MGVIAAIGFEIFIGVVIGAILSVIGLFFGHIILFESIGLAVASGFLAHGFLNIHPALCILIGLAVCALLFWLQHTKFGFWIVGGIMSLLWGFAVGLLVYDGTHKDTIWTLVSWSLVTFLMMALHRHARNKLIED